MSPAYRKNLDFCRDIKSPSLDKGWPDEKFQNDFKKICRDQKPLGPIWIFLNVLVNACLDVLSNFSIEI